MKVAVFGLPEFPLKKHTLPDERLGKLKKLFNPPKTTPVQIEFVDKDAISEAEGILCSEDKKLDLIIHDLEILEERLNQAPQGEEYNMLLKAKENLEKEIFLLRMDLSEDFKKKLSNYNLHTLKPIVLASSSVSLDVLLRDTFQAMGRVCFFTVNEKELRAWPIRKGTTSFDASGYIHSDIQRGFIRAEVVGFEDLIKAGGINQAKSQGLMHLEGKDYIIQDADLIRFRFSV